MDPQPSLFDLPLAPRRPLPEGFRYQPDLITIAEERAPVGETGEALPRFLLPLLEQVAAFTGFAQDGFRHALVTEYAPGAGIGWHRDRPPAVAIVGVSLQSPSTFRLRRKLGDRWDRASITAAARSAYLMSGPSRSDWQHSIPPVETLLRLVGHFIDEGDNHYFDAVAPSPSDSA